MKRFCNFIIIITLFCLCCIPVFAGQWEYYIPIHGINDVSFLNNELYCATGSGLFVLDADDFTYRRITRVEGFPAVAANRILPENDTTLLVATYIPGDTEMGSGIYRYDLESTAWHLLDSPYPPGYRPPPYVRDMARDSDGNVWILGDESLFLVKGNSLVEQTADTGLPDSISSPISLFADIHGDIWMSYNSEEGSGVSRRKDDIWITVLERPGKALGNLTIAPDGTIWFSQSGSVHAYDGSEVTDYDVSWIGGDNVGRIATTSDNSVWCATKDRLVQIRDGETEDMTERFLQALEAAIAPHPFYGFSKVYSNGNEVWVSVHCGEVFAEYTVLGRYSEDKWRFFVPGPNLIYPYGIGSPHYIAVGDDGSLWMAGFFTMWPQPAVQFDNGSWRLYRDVNWLCDIAVGGDNRVWFFGRDVHYYQNGEWTVFRSNEYPLFEDMLRAGTVTPTCAWAGDGYGNVYSYEFGSEWIKYAGEEIGVDYVTSIAAEDGWGVWVTGREGAAYFDGYEWKLYTADNTGLPVNSVRYAAFDQDGTIWFATRGGLVSFDGSSWKVFTTENSGLSNNEVTHVMTAQNGDLWIGTKSGLCMYDGASWESFTKENAPLPSGRIRETSEAPDGSIWIADEGGLCRYIPDNVTGFTENNGQQPTSIIVTGAYPNPFNISTTISFILPSPGFTSLIIYNIMGQKIRNLYSGTLNSGIHNIIWDGMDNFGSYVSSGVYISRLVSSNRVAHKKMMLVK